MNNNDLLNYQNNLIELLKEFGKICNENSINYSLHGGTLLGAERNKRIIPWDDDIDISITRDNYRKLKNILKNDYKDVDIKYVLWIPRFFIKNNGGECYIDLLIWDFISENIIPQFIKISLLRFMQGTFKDKLSTKNVLYGFFEILAITIGKLFSYEKKILIYDYISEFVLTGKRVKLHKSNDSFVGINEVFNASELGTYTDIKFEGDTYKVFKNYKILLIESFGIDYLKLPPYSERIPKHNKL